MIFTNSHLQTCSPAHSCLSASAQEFQPRVQSETWKSGEMQQLPVASDLIPMSCHEAPSCLPYQYHAPLPSELQPLYQSVYQADSQPLYSTQVCFYIPYQSLEKSGYIHFIYFISALGIPLKIVLFLSRALEPSVTY